MNPSKQNRSQGSPDTASAVVTAEGPGSDVTAYPASRAARAARYPGSLTEGIPASVTSATVPPPASTASSRGRRSRSTSS